MARAATAALCLSLSLIAVTGPAGAQEASLQQCKFWQDRIDYYTKLRKQGGKARQMEDWKQRRAEYEEKFKDAKCKEYGWQVR